MFSNTQAFIRRYVMPIVIGLLCVAVVAIASTFATPAATYAQVKPNFSGNWQLDPAGSDTPEARARG